METGMGLENKDDTNWQQAQSGDLDKQTASTDANFQAGFHIFIINIKCICFLNLGMLLPLIFNIWDIQIFIETYTLSSTYFLITFFSVPSSLPSYSSELFIIISYISYMSYSILYKKFTFSYTLKIPTFLYFST